MSLSRYTHLFDTSLTPSGVSYVYKGEVNTVLRYFEKSIFSDIFPEHCVDCGDFWEIDFFSLCDAISVKLNKKECSEFVETSFCILCAILTIARWHAECSRQDKTYVNIAAVVGKAFAAKQLALVSIYNLYHLVVLGKNMHTNTNNIVQDFILKRRDMLYLATTVMNGANVFSLIFVCQPIMEKSLRAYPSSGVALFNSSTIMFPCDDNKISRVSDENITMLILSS